MLVVDWNPTAENIARMILKFLSQKGYPVTDVSVGNGVLLRQLLRDIALAITPGPIRHGAHYS
jgi:hypothetical protein